jgi:hypothetical protein
MPPPVGEWAAFSSSPRQESGRALDRGEILLQGSVTAAQLRLALAHGSATLEDCVIDAGNYKVLPGKRLLICGSVVFMGPSTISLSSHSGVRGVRPRSVRRLSPRLSVIDVPLVRAEPVQVE